MKITAIEGRGTKKRFCRYLLFVGKVSIEKCYWIYLYPKTYAELIFCYGYEQFCYFEDAEEEPMPYMFVDVSWDEIKKSILSRL